MSVWILVPFCLGVLVVLLYPLVIREGFMIVYSKASLVQELIRDEGIRLNAYKDSQGNWTIAVGHLLRKGDPYRVTQEQAIQMLYKDILIAESRLTRIYPPWRELDDVRQRALLNLTFNMGFRLAKFVNFFSYLRQGRYELAGVALKNSRWYSQVGDRAPRVINMIVNGDS